MLQSKNKANWKRLGRSTSPLKQGKGLRPIGKAGKATIEANKANKERFEANLITYCQICGTTMFLSNSHSEKRRFKPELTRSALLCAPVCHKWIDEDLTHEEQKLVNDFIIDNSDMEGEERFRQMLKLVPQEKGEKLWRNIQRAYA